MEDLIPIYNGGGDFTDDLMDLQEGAYDAVVVFVADCGMQENTYNHKMQPKVAIGFELEVPNLDHHVVMYKEVTNSAGSNGNLYDLVTTLIDSWTAPDLATPVNGQRFNLQMLLNRQATIRVTRHGKNGNEYKRAIIQKVLPGRGKIVQPSEPAFAYGLKMGRNDVFSKLPYFLQKDIEKNLGDVPAPVQEAPKAVDTSNAAEPLDISELDLPF